MGDFWIVNSDSRLANYHRYVDEMYHEHRHLTFQKPRIGVYRSLTQNDLFHVWVREFAAHLAQCETKAVTPGMIDGLKHTLKEWYYRHTNYPWLVEVKMCPLTKRSKPDFTSSKSWHHGEMFEFLNWFQALAAEKHCLLESKGEHAKLVKKHNGVAS